MKSKAGFTMIELLVVIAVLAILVSIVLLAINPGKQFEDTKAQKRKADMIQILNAVTQYMISNQGQTPVGLTSDLKEIGDFDGMIDLCGDLVPMYIAGIPQDADKGPGVDQTACAFAGNGTYQTDYAISILNERIIVSSIDDPVLSVSR
ncbi:type II secretion system protein [Candidatus Woesebacteria bacterium]|nr:type II secretion system protein [Candidatus Woesebacteria bacterium]